MSSSLYDISLFIFVDFFLLLTLEKLNPTCEGANRPRYFLLVTDNRCIVLVIISSFLFEVSLRFSGILMSG